MNLGFDFVDLKLGNMKCVQRYMQQHNEVELSALGMGTFRLILFYFMLYKDGLYYVPVSFILG